MSPRHSTARVGSRLALFLAVACARAAPPVTPVVHRFDAGEAGLYVNAYLVETPSGIVAIDATLTESSSKALRATLDSLGKPLLAVLLTHGHPDHYNGVTNLVAGTTVPGVPILATAGVDSVIRANDAAKDAQWRPVFKDEWPSSRTFPNRIVRDGDTVSFGGVTFSVHDLGPGESHHDSYWLLEGPSRAAFVGDEVLHGVHAYAADGHTTRWLANLEQLSTALQGVATIYPGHGDPGGPGILVWQRDYLLAYRQAVAELSHDRPTLTPPAKTELVARMKQYLPTTRLEFLIVLGADPVAAELRATP